MKKLFIILVSSVVLTACESKQERVEISVLENSAFEGVKSVEHDKLDFSDPARIVGSSFGDFFISMLRTQNYEMALKFTSKGSIERFGKDKILDKYKEFQFNYVLSQKSISKEGDSLTIAYTTNEFATGKLKKITVVLENDSCKLVLPDNINDLLK